MSRTSAAWLWLPPHSSTTRRMCARSISSSVLPSPVATLCVLKIKSCSLSSGSCAYHHRALDRIFQFADVSHPRLLLQLVHGCRRDAGDALVHRQRELSYEVVDQHRNVVAPLAQWRQLNMEDVEPVKKVRPELPFLDQLFQILVGGGDATEVDLDQSGCRRLG